MYRHMGVCRVSVYEKGNVVMIFYFQNLDKGYTIVVCVLLNMYLMVVSNTCISFHLTHTRGIGMAQCKPINI